MGDVYHDLKHFSDRYVKLRNLFAQLHKEGAQTLTTGNLSGLVVGDLTDGKYFDVSLAGITARFSFAFQPVESSARVTVYRAWTPWKPENLESVAHFEFNGQGIVAGMKMPNGHFEDDDLRVNTDSHGSYLVATYLHKALTAKPGPVASQPPLKTASAA
jgi:hypothetical protein